MRISDWSSDVCSSDLVAMEDASADARTATAPIKGRGAASRVAGRFDKTTYRGEDDGWGSVYADAFDDDGEPRAAPRTDRKSVAAGKGCVSPCRSRWAPQPSKQNKNKSNRKIRK